MNSQFKLFLVAFSSQTCAKQDQANLTSKKDQLFWTKFYWNLSTMHELISNNKFDINQAFCRTDFKLWS